MITQKQLQTEEKQTKKKIINNILKKIPKNEKLLTEFSKVYLESIPTRHLEKSSDKNNYTFLKERFTFLENNINYAPSLVLKNSNESEFFDRKIPLS